MLADEQTERTLAHIGIDGRQHSLQEHLLSVANLAAENAADFNSENWARKEGCPIGQMDKTCV